MIKPAQTSLARFTRDERKQTRGSRRSTSKHPRHTNEMRTKPQKKSWTRLVAAAGDWWQAHAQWERISCAGSLCCGSKRSHPLLMRAGWMELRLSLLLWRYNFDTKRSASWRLSATLGWILAAKFSTTMTPARDGGRYGGFANATGAKGRCAGGRRLISTSQ